MVSLALLAAWLPQYYQRVYPGHCLQLSSGLRSCCTPSPSRPMTAMLEKAQLLLLVISKTALANCGV
jgi:hypothetical protein